MDNHGQIYATDRTPAGSPRSTSASERAGARNVQVRTPRGRADAVTDLDGKADLVVVDAPARAGHVAANRTPSGVRPGSLETRVKEQADALDRAAGLVRPGGRIVYVTCSVLPQENDDAVAAFVERSGAVAPVEPAHLLAEAPESLRGAVMVTRHGVQMTPRRTGTDGFYVAALRRA